ncbi:hypothetical protein RDI58_019418 [Solanum bulbocastanum]|uniref:Uncharacterized protein n=1 Tax=Solanum bulbocastanum TaxID=147425 RepID=A0AAN8TAL0_SOLBU
MKVKNNGKRLYCKIASHCSKINSPTSRDDLTAFVVALEAAFYPVSRHENSRQ